LVTIGAGLVFNTGRYLWINSLRKRWEVGSGKDWFCAAVAAIWLNGIDDGGIDDWGVGCGGGSCGGGSCGGDCNGIVCELIESWGWEGDKSFKRGYKTIIWLN